MRRCLLTLTAALALAVAAAPAEAQLKFGAHGAVLTGLDEVTVLGVPYNTFNNTFGLGGRVMLDPPLLPVALVGSGTYYFAEGDTNYWTGTLAGQLRLPLPVVKPYATLGWQIRNRYDETENGLMAGIGMQLDLAVSLFLEGAIEVGSDLTVGTTDIDTTQIVIKGGLMFG
jgi:hypothetical protein